MMSSDSPPALREFVAHRSESSFRELLREHSPQVFATAMRKLGGDRAAAQDVTQEVFSLLARKADRLGSVVLGGWLYRQTCRRAANHVRSETRRKKRETAVMPAHETTTPADVLDSRLLARELDDAMLTLPAADRDALVLRFFEGKGYSAIGQALGLGEDAARKRIQRALERLAVSFKRRGIVVGGVVLGTALESFGAAPVSKEMISQLSNTALKSSPASIAVVALIKPALTGIFAVSLVSGTALALREVPPPAEAAVATSIPPRNVRQGSISVDLHGHPSLERIIIEIKRGTSGPINSLSTLRLNSILGKIVFDDAQAFFELANSQLDVAEKAATYHLLLGRWLKEDPLAVMDLTLNARIGEQVDEFLGTNLLLNLFQEWSREDEGGTEKWLFVNWENETLKKDAFEGSLRNFMAAGIAEHRLASGDFDSAFRFVSRAPSVSDRGAVLLSLVGPVPRRQPWRSMSGEQILHLQRKLQEFPDPAIREKLVFGLWSNLGRERADLVGELQEKMNSREKFDAAVGMISVTSKPIRTTPVLGGGFLVQSEPVTDGPAREQAAVEAGLAAGVSRTEIWSAIGRAQVGRSGFFEWFDAHREDLAMDDTLAEFARKAANASGWVAGSEMVGMEWARRIVDPQLRLALTRAIFRRALLQFPDAAIDYLNTTELPAEVAAELQEILSAEP